MIKLATPVSHLFQSESLAQRIRSLSDCLECRDFTIENTSPNQELFHCELQPIHDWGEEQWKYLVKVREKKQDLRLISFHMASCCDKPSLEGIWFVPGGKVYSREQMIANALGNLSKIRKIFGPHVSVIVENNNYYPTPAYDYVTDADFISEIVNGAGIGLLFDVSHAAVTAHNRGISFKDYIAALPLASARQIHLCSHGIRDDSIAFDAHEPPKENEWGVVAEVLENFDEVRYLTVEFYKDIEILCESLKIARDKVNDLYRSAL
ncbi:MAG: DUF692 family protein [Lentisphaeraceae bacterium]|nr:DUF692 family protein [Lentisphaeraceae bacterium]